jgi:hypothetical protein
MAVRIQFRRGTAAEWTAANPTLSAGEFGFETDTRQFKLGDGSTAWSGLAYPATGTITEVVAGTGLSGGGTSGSVTLDINSSIYIAPEIVDAKGDIVVGTAADTPGILPVGTNGQYLTANSSTSTGLEWKTLTTDLIISSQTASYILISGDKGSLVRFTNSSAATVTVPSGVFATGEQVTLLRYGSGTLAIAAGSGATVNATPGLNLRAQYSAATLICLDGATSTFVVLGDLSA